MGGSGTSCDSRLVKNARSSENIVINASFGVQSFDSVVIFEDGSGVFATA